MEKRIIYTYSAEELEKLIRACICSEIQKHFAPTTSPKTEFISRKEAASLLGISLVTLGDYCKRGVLISYRIGSNVRFKEHEIILAVSQVKTFKNKRGEFIK